MICEDCAPYRPEHFLNWVSDLFELIVTPFFETLLPVKVIHRGEKLIDDIFVELGLFSPEADFPLNEINPISALFITHARKRGLHVLALKSPFGYSRYFRIKIGGREFDFEVLPRAEMAVKKKLSLHIDDKWVVKRELQTQGFPVALGKSFWWFQVREAIQWMRGAIGYPVIVKPRKGTLSQHVYYDIKDEAELTKALRKVKAYSPVFILEQFIPDAALYRVTVVDHDRLFAVKRSPPVVVGDGLHSIQELAAQKNISPGLFSHAVLAAQGFTPDSVPGCDTMVRLHRKIIHSLGAVFDEVALEEMHEENVALCKDIAAHFGNRLIGIDFLCQDIGTSWRKQRCAILELNSLPNIQMHSFTASRRSSDEQTNEMVRNDVAEALVDLVLKYYR